MDPATLNLPAPLWRRLAALVYDALIVVALWMLATALVLPFTGGEAIAAGRVWYQIYLFVVAAGFFILFWRLGGQTLGMRAWRLHIVDADGGRVSWARATLRAVAALPSALAFGAGFLWSLFDAERRAWHDVWSHTRLVHTPSK